MLLSYLILFSCSLVLGSLMCNGIWIATDGRTDDMVDGSEHDTEKMVLYRLYKLLANPKKVYFRYNNHHLKLLLSELKAKHPQYKQFIDSMGVESDSAICQVSDTEKLKEFVLYLKSVGDLVDIKTEVTSNVLIAFKYYWAVRFWSKPIVACIKCFPSFWGSITFFSLVALFSHLGILYEIDYNVVVPMWLFVVVCMSPLNVLIEKLVRNEH